MRILTAVLLAVAVLAVQVLYGGAMRTVFALPAYFLVAACGLLAVGAIFWKRAVPPDGWAVAGVLGTGIYLCWRSMNSPGQDLAVFYTLLVLACLTAYLVTACVLTTPQARYTLVGILLFATMGQAVVAAMQFTGEARFFPFPWISEQLRIWNDTPAGAGYRRGHGSFLSGNQLAWLFNVMAFFGFGVAAFGRCRLWVKIVFAYMGGVCVVGVLITLSRGGAVGLAVGLLVFAFLAICGLALGARDRRFVFLLATVSVVVVGMCGAFFLFQNSDIVKARLDRVAEDSYRLTLWRAAVRQGQIEPVLGTGAGSFTQLSRQYSDFMAGSNDMYAHNDWAQVVSDFGFVGFGLVLFAFGASLKAGIGGFFRALRERMANSSRPQSNSAAFLAGAISACAAAAAHSFFDYNMQIPANALLLAICVGIMANSGVPQSRRTRAGHAVRVGAALSAVGCGAFLLFLVNQHSVVEARSLLAENEMLAGSPAVAVVLAGEALERHPSHSRLQRILGESLLRRAATDGPDGQRDLGQAAAALRRAIEGDALERWSYLLLGMTLGRVEDIHGAVGAHIDAIRLDPGSAAMYEYYALTLEQYGRSADAIRAYEISLRVPGTRFARQRLEALRLQTAEKP